MPTPTPSSLRGALFEWLIRSLLFHCGFRQVVPDGLTVYSAGPGLMVHGLGQPHNADVLMEPPFQIPFYYPSRLLVECKWYSDPIGLPIARSALGLRNDLNNFEIVTPSALAARRNYRRKVPALGQFQRVVYQVALASATGFKITAQEFAHVHRIPLISMACLPAFLPFRVFLRRISNDTLPIDIERLPLIMRFLNAKFQGGKDEESAPREIAEFVGEARQLFSHIFLGVLESGDLIFLHSIGAPFAQEHARKYSSTITWVAESRCWRLSLPGTRHLFEFELPSHLYDAWAGSGFDRVVALNQKELHFKRIHVYGMETGQSTFCTFQIPEEFFEQWRSRHAEE